MMQFLLIGIGAGAAAGLLFASIASGALAAAILFYLAPLPVLIAALGWSHVAALIAVATAGLGLGLVYGPFLAGTFLVIAGIPAWWLGYLAMLARPVNAEGSLEWYPIGRLVIWAAVIGPLVVAMAIPNFGMDYESFRDALRTSFQQILDNAGQGAGQGQSAQNLSGMLDTLVAVVPVAAAIVSTLMTLLNLWLAGKIVSLSGRLRRPWPDLSAIELPRNAAYALIAAVLAMMLPGLVGVLAGAVAASLAIAFAALGFAVLHVLTRGMAARGLMLGAAYASALFVGWPVLVVAIVGFAESFLHLRARAVNRPPLPPASNSNIPN